MASSSNDPTTGAPIFDDVDAPDLAVNPTEVAAFAASVGTRLIGTTAERTAYTYAREGIEWFDTTLDAVYVHNGTGWVNSSGLTVRNRSSALNLTSTDSAIDWDTAESAPSPADFTYSAGVFTASSPGRFRVHAQLTLSAAGATGAQISVMQNGSLVASSDIITSPTGGVTLHVHRDFILAAAGTVQIRGVAGATIPVAVTFPRQSFVEIVRL